MSDRITPVVNGRDDALEDRDSWIRVRNLGVRVGRVEFDLGGAFADAGPVPVRRYPRVDRVAVYELALAESGDDRSLRVTHRCDGRADKAR